MPMKLYAHPENYRTKNILICATFAQLDVETAGKTDDKQSIGKIPVLETDQGCIFASNAIARYLSRIRRDLGLYGQNLIENGMVDSWIEFCTQELEIPLCAWVYPIMGIFEEVPEATKQAKEDVKRALHVLNNHLLQNTYMVGNQITLADICLACSLVDGMRLVFDEDFRKPFANVMRWFNTCMAQPEFTKIWGKVQILGEKGGSGGKAAAKKEAAPKKETAPKKESAPKKEAAPKQEGKKKDKGAPKAEAKKDEAPAEKTPEQLAEDRKKQLKKVIKEGGKRGVEIEGAADMGGLQYFCTSMDECQGDLEFIEASMTAMNAESDPTEEERKGGSGKIGKMIFSAGDDKLAIAAYVPKDLQKDNDASVWLKHVLGMFSGEVVKGDKGLAIGKVVKNDDKGVFPLKVKEPGIMEAISYLKKKGLFPDKEDSDDDYVFGDDDFPS